MTHFYQNIIQLHISMGKFISILKISCKEEINSCRILKQTSYHEANSERLFRVDYAFVNLTALLPLQHHQMLTTSSSDGCVQVHQLSSGEPIPVSSLKVHNNEAWITVSVTETPMLSAQVGIFTQISRNFNIPKSSELQ